MKHIKNIFSFKLLIILCVICFSYGFDFSQEDKQARIFANYALTDVLEQKYNLTPIQSFFTTYACAIAYEYVKCAGTNRKPDSDDILANVLGNVLYRVTWTILI